MKILRWFLVAPLAIAAWYATAITGISVYWEIRRRACPPEMKTISGACYDPEVMRLLAGVEMLFIALCAIVVVCVAAAVAPSHRAVVAWIAFIAGALVAGYFAISTMAYAAGIAAVGCGLITVMLFREPRHDGAHRRHRHERVRLKITCIPPKTYEITA